MKDRGTSEKRQAPKPTPVDALKAQRRPREERPYVCISWKPERPDGEIRKRFDTLSELLAYAQSEEMRNRAIPL
jgi:hypothetical protein